jgi:hypothetical protein
MSNTVERPPRVATSTAEKDLEKLTLAHTEFADGPQALTTAFLAERAQRIRLLGRAITADIVEIGRLLIQCKQRLPHGAWLPWLDGEFRWTDQTARNFMRVADMASNSKRVLDLDIPLHDLYRLAAPSTPAAARDEVIERATAGEKLARDDISEIISRHGDERAAVRIEQQAALAAPVIAANAAPTSEKPHSNNAAHEPAAANAAPPDSLGGERLTQPSLRRKFFALVAAWDDATPDDQRHFLFHIGASFNGDVPGRLRRAAS